jgi:hypothetical protein
MSMKLKTILGNIPGAADLYDAMSGSRPKTRYNLEQLAANLPAAVEQTRPFAEKALPGRKILLFATLHFWIEQAALVGLALRGMGHSVTIAYLPYGNFDKELNAFDLRRQELYTRRVLQPLNGLVKVISLLDIVPTEVLPEALVSGIKTSAAFDTMYTLQVEDFDPESSLYRLRMERNRDAALKALSLLQRELPEVVLIPNGLVTELGVFYQVARFSNLMTVTYEFNDQREQIWLSQNEIVMRQNMDSLWAARSNCMLTEAQREEIAALEDARTKARKYGKGTRFWQDVASVGGEELRQALGLDSRPIVLLATNVLGDSLTLGRHIFASSMAEWIEKTVQFFVRRPDVQLVVRVHPGERLMKGPSISDVIERAAPGLPENIHVISPMEKVNTYDIMEIAGLGLAYTTTVGMEMAMRGEPVIVAGNTHYRGRGFTYEPNSWEDYYALLTKILSDPPGNRLSQQQVETAWNFAYRFFFEFPLPFPWRLMHFWKDAGEWPIERVLSEEGRQKFGRTFDCLAGQDRRW